MLIQHQDEAYKRGLVLGLTMAEIVILVLFTLLLLLGGLLARNREMIEEQAARLETYEAIIAELSTDSGATPEGLELVAVLKEYWERHAPQDVDIRDYFSQLVLRVEELEKLRAELEELAERRRDELEAALADAARLSRELEAKSAENEQLSQEVASLADELEDSLEKRQLLEAEVAGGDALLEEIDQLNSSLEEAGQQLSEARQELAEAMAEAEQLAQEVDDLGAALDEALGEIAEKEQEAAAAHGEVEQLNAALETSLQQLSQVEGERQQLAEQAESLDGLGLDLSREEDRQALETAVSLMRQASASGTDFEEMTNMISTLEGEIGDMRRLIAFYERRFGYPPCWHDGDFRIDFTFDVKLTSSGYVLRRVEHARHVDHPIMPQVMNVSTGREIPTSSFVEQTRPLFDWSVANECRFYVTVYDGTAENEKRIYQDRMRTLEGHFYKLERVNEPAPF